MVCNKCNMKYICIVYKTLESNNLINSINIDNCAINSLNSTNSKSSNNKNVNANDFSYTGRVKKDINEKNKKKVKYNVIPNLCICGADTFKEDLDVCYKCGKQICSVCSTIYNKNKYCSECWKEV